MDEVKVMQKLIEHDEQLERIEENMATKANMNDILTGIDKSMAILQRLDQERLFTVERIKEIENDVEKIKEHLHIK